MERREEELRQEAGVAAALFTIRATTRVSCAGCCSSLFQDTLHRVALRDSGGGAGAGEEGCARSCPGGLRTGDFLTLSVGISGEDLATQGEIEQLYECAAMIQERHESDGNELEN
jgi:hypothetical protein